MKSYGFGVDIGGTTIKLGLFDMGGALLDKWEIPTRTENNGENILDDICESITKKMHSKFITKERVEGIGLGVPGPVGEDGTVYGCVNLGWPTFNVETTMYQKIGIPVKAGNDANVAALGEMWQGGGKGHQDVLMVTLGTGVGGGIIIGGKVIAGAHGAGGEIGHIHVKDNEPVACGCGKHGCLEQYVSANGIVSEAKRKLENETRSTSLTQYDFLTSKDIYDEAKNGDTVALEIVDEACELLGDSLAIICNVVDPEVIVIGGGVSRAGNILIEGIKKHYHKNAFHSVENTDITLALLGNDAGMYGCVRQLF